MGRRFGNDITRMTGGIIKPRAYKVGPSLLFMCKSCYIMFFGYFAEILNHPYEYLCRSKVSSLTNPSASQQVRVVKW